jgi:16S rRNA (guanine1207-N2)-methyltransferase
MKEADAALDVLFHPFDTGALAWPRAGGALFLRARDGWPLHASARPGLVCEQSYKPEFDALSRSGLEVVEEGAAPDTTFPLVLVLPPRQRDEARALFARALDRAGDDGVVVACMHNDEGAKTGQADLARVAGASTCCRSITAACSGPARAKTPTTRCVRNGARSMRRAWWSKD